MFGPTYDDLRRVSIGASVQNIALTILLLEKGVISSDEYEKAIARATSLVDQEWERRERESNREAIEDDPGLGVFAKLMGVEIRT